MVEAVYGLSCLLIASSGNDASSCGTVSAPVSGLRPYGVVEVHVTRSNVCIGYNSCLLIHDA